MLAARRAVNAVHASDALIAYVQALLARSRRHPGVRVGLSPRAGLALLRAARAYALLLGRAHVLPEDVQALFARGGRAPPRRRSRGRQRRSAGEGDPARGAGGLRASGSR